MKKYSVLLLTITANGDKVKSKPLESFDTLEEATQYQQAKNNVLRFNNAPQRAITIENKEAL